MIHLKKLRPPKPAKKKIKAKKVKRPYKVLLKSLVKVWRIEPVYEHKAFQFFGKSKNTHLDPKLIKLGVWNLCKGAGDIHFEHDCKILIKRCDIFLGQEALFSEASIKLFSLPNYSGVHAASYVRADDLKDGVVTISHSKISGIPKRIICKYPEPIFHTPKVAMYNFFNLQDTHEKLLVVNLHATLVRTIKGAQEELHHLISHLPEHSGPMILAGDFNTLSPQYLKAIERDLKKIDLSKVELQDDHRSMFSSLDYVFTRQLKTVKAMVDFSIKSSDHFPLICHFEVT